MICIFFPDVMWVIKSRWVEYVERMGKQRIRTEFWWENTPEEDRFKYVCGRIILKRVINSIEGCES
jgi:hypothetical protein